MGGNLIKEFDNAMDNNQLIKKGIELCQKGQFLQAIEFFQVVIENDPKKEEAYLWLADAYEGMGKTDSAKSTVYKYLALNPSSKAAIEKIKSLDLDNYATAPSGLNSQFKKDKINYKVECGSERKTDYDFYIVFDDGNIVALNIEGTNAVVLNCNYVKGKLYIPDRVVFKGNTYTITKIGDDAFKNCGDIKEVYLPQTIEEIGDGSFYNCGSLRVLDIGSNIQSIGDKAFESCRSLKSIVLSNSINHIGNECFSYCKSLKSIVFPDGIEEIGRGMMKYCDYLETITIPASVKRIKDEAFYSCGSPKISMLGLPPLIEQNTFLFTNPIIVLSKSILSYYQKSHYWKSFKLVEK